MHGQFQADRRETKRFAIRYPFAVEVSNRPNHQTNVRGRICDIQIRGARVALGQPVQPGIKLTLLVHYWDPEKRTRRSAGKESFSVSKRSHDPELL